MFVRQLIGREAGTIQDQPYHAATSNIAAGTAEAVTDEELARVGLTRNPGAGVAAPEVLPEGYAAKADEVSGFIVFDPDGVALNEQPFPNMAAARSFAHEHAAAAAAAKDPEPALEDMTVAQLKDFAEANKIELGENTRKDDIKAAIQLELEARATAAAGQQGNQSGENTQQ